MATSKFVVTARGLFTKRTAKGPMEEIEIGEKVSLAVDDYGMPNESVVPFVDVSSVKRAIAKANEEEYYEEDEDLGE